MKQRFIPFIEFEKLPNNKILYNGKIYNTMYDMYLLIEPHDILHEPRNNYCIRMYRKYTKNGYLRKSQYNKICRNRRILRNDPELHYRQKTKLINNEFKRFCRISTF